MSPDDRAESTVGEHREEDECPRCGNRGYENPVLDDTYECNRCVIAFTAEGEVLENE